MIGARVVKLFIVKKEIKHSTQNNCLFYSIIERTRLCIQHIYSLLIKRESIQPLYECFIVTKQFNLADRIKLDTFDSLLSIRRTFLICILTRFRRDLERHTRVHGAIVEHENSFSFRKIRNQSIQSQSRTKSTCIYKISSNPLQKKKKNFMDP